MLSMLRSPRVLSSTYRQSQKMAVEAASFSSASTSEILTEMRADKAIVTLNRPKALNALNLTMVRHLFPLFKDWSSGSDVAMVIVKGAGEKAFCAGGDVLAVSRAAQDCNAGGQATMHRDFFREEYQLNHLIGTFKKPYVAFIDGITMGGGCGMSVNGRFRVATERTMLSMPETALGLFPDVGGSYFLSRLKHNVGMYLALTGYRLVAADAFHAGIATHYVNSADLPALEDHLVKMNKPNEQDVDDAIRAFQPKEVPAFSLKEKLPQIREIFQSETVEEIIEKLHNKNDEWSQKQVQTLLKMSPTSLKVTVEQLHRGAKTTFPNVFPMEYRLTQRFMAGHDFHEGVRAILVDKDRKPKWKPATLEEVSASDVEKYFSALPKSEELTLQKH